MNQCIKVNNKKVNTFSTLFEDNASAFQLATESKCIPQIKHIGVKHHHCRQYFKNKTTHIRAIDTNNKPVDTFNKPLPHDKFVKC